MAEGQARGRQAIKPTQIPRAGWRDILLRVKDELTSDHVSIVAAGVAFFGLLAVFPGIAAILSIAGLVMDPMEVEAQLEQMTAALPAGVAEILQEQAREVAQGAGAGLGFAAILGLLVSLYSASKGMKTLMEGMNVAYEEDEKRGFIRYNLVALVLTLLLIVGLLVAIGFVVVVPAVLAAIGLGGALEGLITYGRWLLLALLAVAGLAVLYRYGPSRDKPQWSWVAPGAVIATLIWILGSIAFSVYVSNFGSYNETYGALGGVIVLLTWLWLSAYVVLLGAELNSEMEHQTRRDTTDGPPEKMGNRGAEMADTLGATP